MEQQKMGRKRLGTEKRQHKVMLRFNQKEYKHLERLAGSYDMDITKRGVLSPLLRRLLLGNQLEEKNRLPDTSNLAHHKNLRSPNASLEEEIRKSNELMRMLLELVEKSYRT